jgi:hypothetical protein
LLFELLFLIRDLSLLLNNCRGTLVEGIGGGGVNPSGSTSCAKFSASMEGLVDVRWSVGVGVLIILD